MNNRTDPQLASQHSLPKPEKPNHREPDFAETPKPRDIRPSSSDNPSSMELLAHQDLSSVALSAQEDLSSVALLAKEGQLTTINASGPIDAKSPPARKIRRNGRIACLPRNHRDMVNHMLWNAVPYKNIVAALGEAGFTVTERNISNWATGGYLEWSLVQEHVIQTRVNQDHLLDFLRREDAPELPEVGLQAAATRLSQVLLQKLARADDPEAHLENYSQLVDLLVRLNREIAVTQKQRDDSRRTLGPEYNPALVKEEEQIEAIENERYYSSPSPDSKLARPAVSPFLPVIPTATQMADQAREKRHEAETQRLKHSMDMQKLLRAKLLSGSSQSQNTQPTIQHETQVTPSPVSNESHDN